MEQFRYLEKPVVNKNSIMKKFKGRLKSRNASYYSV